MATKPKLQVFEIMAVIPTGQYANVQPKLIYEAEDFDAAYKAAMPHLQKISQDYGDVQLVNKDNGVALQVNRTEVQCYATGTKAYFDPVGHTYIDEKGTKYTSGSVYAGQFEHEFNKALILPRYAAKCNVDESLIEEMWTSKADASTTFGTALHQALETYGKYKELCDLIGKDIGIHPTLIPIVEAFFKDRQDEQAVYEPFVADARNLRCGFIDRLLITGEKRCIIEDYKTNADLYKKGTPANLKAPYHYLPNVPLSRYMIQLSFYKAIMEAAGWMVEGLRVHWWNGKDWKAIDLKPVQIDIKQEPIDLSKVL